MNQNMMNLLLALAVIVNSASILASAIHGMNVNGKIQLLEKAVQERAEPVKRKAE